MSDSAYLHFLSLTFLSIISLTIIFKSDNHKKLCKCPACLDARNLYSLKNGFNEKSTSRKIFFIETLKNKKILLLTFSLIFFSIFSLKNSDKLYDGLPEAYKILEVDMEATLLDIEAAHRKKLISIRKLKGKKNYLDLQTKISDAYNLLKLKVKNKKPKIEDLKTLKDVPSSYLIISCYILISLFFIYKFLKNRKRMNSRNKYGIKFLYIDEVIKSKILNNAQIFKKEGAISFLSNFIERIVLEDISLHFLDIDEIDIKTFLKMKIGDEEAINKLCKVILTKTYKKLEASFPYSHIRDFNFISLCIYLQIYRSNILEEILKDLLKENLLLKKEKDQILNLKDKIIFTIFQSLPTLKKICVNKQVLFCLLRLQTDLLRGCNFSRQIGSKKFDEILTCLKKNQVSSFYERNVKSFEPPLTVYTAKMSSLKTENSQNLISSIYLPQDSHTIVKLKKNEEKFKRDFLQKNFSKETKELIHDPFFYPLKYDGIFSLLKDNTVLSRISNYKSLYENRNLIYKIFDKGDFYLPRKSYTLILYVNNTVISVQNIFDFIGEKDIILENRGKNCLLYCDFTGMITQIQ